jgi:hypothetical protein
MVSVGSVVLELFRVVFGAAAAVGMVVLAGVVLVGKLARADRSLICTFLREDGEKTSVEVIKELQPGVIIRRRVKQGFAIKGPEDFPYIV